MNINPVQGFKNLTPNQKKAAVAGAIGTAAAAASVVLAYSKGKNPDVKGIKAIKAGYIKLGQNIAETAGKAFKSVKDAFNLKNENSLISKAKDGVLELVKKVGNLFKKSEEVAEGAKEAAEKIAG
ncbi:MAG: hypothetical protein IJ003_00720 [Candidatus Gastranaerophilales bacterium]|nr:hypothetical protein [Candidatus Gastranaerophilales bacterium]